MKIKKIKSQGEFIYPATIAAAVKDANFLKESGSPMTQGEINTNLSENKVDKVTGKSLVDDIEISKLVDLPNKTTLDSAIADAKKTGTDAQNSLSKHTLNTTNPHNVTKEQVGLGSVDNTSDIDKPISTKTQTALDTKVDKETGKELSTNDFTDDLLEKLNGIESGAQVNTVTGIKGNAETTYRTGDINITPDNVGAVALIEKGAASGVVPLNDQKLIDAKYLPSYVDDVEEYAGKDNFPTTGESGKIYVDTTVEENNTYRWSGSTYILIAKNTNTTYTLSKDGSTIKLTGNDGSVTTVEDDNTTYSNATLTVSGLMSSTDKSKLDGIATGANKYIHPSYTSATSGLYKVTVDSTGHVSEVTDVTKSDITNLGIPAQDTTYSNATTSTAGLMSKDDKSKLDGIASNANNYSLPTASSTTLGGVKSITTGTTSGRNYNVEVNSDGTMKVNVPWVNDNTTYSIVTTTTNGLMSSTDKSKLDNLIWLGTQSEYDALSSKSDYTIYLIKEEYVDLGLSSGTLWAKCNIGATKETDYGLFFQWGDTVGYDEDSAAAHSTWSTCPGNGGNSSYDTSALTTWNTANLTNNVLNTSVDAAYVHTNGKAKMPTLTQVQELINGTNSEWTTIDGVAGRKFTNKTDSSKYIFIPAAGCFYGGSRYNKGLDGDVWSSSLNASLIYHAYALDFGSGSGSVSTRYGVRRNAFSVRGVKNV